MDEKNFRKEKGSIEELRSVREALVKDIVRGANRDIDATMRELLDKYIQKVTEMYIVEMKVLNDRRERERRKR